MRVAYADRSVALREIEGAARRRYSLLGPRATIARFPT